MASARPKASMPASRVQKGSSCSPSRSRAIDHVEAVAERGFKQGGAFVAGLLLGPFAQHNGLANLAWLRAGTSASGESTTCW